MGWMATALNFICRLAGYSSCGALSTFEAIILAAITLAVGMFLIMLFFAIVTSKPSG